MAHAIAPYYQLICKCRNILTFLGWTDLATANFFLQIHELEFLNLGHVFYVNILKGIDLELCPMLCFCCLHENG